VGVGAYVAYGVEGAVDIEDADGVALDFDSSCFAGFEVVGFAGWNEGWDLAGSFN
jgi:hypothetical protein